MNRHKLLFAVIALAFTGIAAIVIYIVFACIFAAYAQYTNPHPEHGLMPLGAAIYAFFPTVVISIFVFYKVYILLVRRYG